MVGEYAAIRQKLVPFSDCRGRKCLCAVRERYFLDGDRTN